MSIRIYDKAIDQIVNRYAEMTQKGGMSAAAESKSLYTSPEAVNAAFWMGIGRNNTQAMETAHGQGTGGMPQPIADGVLVYLMLQNKMNETRAIGAWRKSCDRGATGKQIYAASYSAIGEAYPEPEDMNRLVEGLRQQVAAIPPAAVGQAIQRELEKQTCFMMEVGAGAALMAQIREMSGDAVAAGALAQVGKKLAAEEEQHD